MARYVTTVRSPWSAADAFEFMADARNFATWDPGVSSSVLVEGDEPGLGAAYDVKVTGTTLRYETTEFEGPDRVVLHADSTILSSHDIVTVVETPEGCEVTYDVELKLKSLLGLVDPLLGLAFGRIGDRASAGLESALEGERVGP